MIMPLKATETGKISHEMSPGSIIAAGDLLASLQLAVSRLGEILCPYTPPFLPPLLAYLPVKGWRQMATTIMCRLGNQAIVFCFFFHLAAF